MERRTFASLAAAAVLGLSLPVGAQAPGKMVRIGGLASSRWDAPEVIAIVQAFRSELQRLGWSEGRNVIFEVRIADGAVERFPALAHELVDLGVDLIFAANGPAAVAAKQVAGAIPIVSATVNDPVGLGLVVSLARPGGTVTGFATMSSELVGKRLQLLKYFTQRKTIVDLIAAQRKPAIYPQVAFAQSGGLMSYSVDLEDQFRRAAGHVDRILRGARPADLPVEQPTRFELVINLRTAKALGITIPQSLLLRADEVIR